MKILLANHTLDHYAGSETFTYALACELQRLGHEIICFSPRLGKLAEHLKDQGVTVTADLASLPNHIDIIHAHHRYESLLAFIRYPSTPMVIVCHGMLPWQEQPLNASLNTYRYVAVSEEVRDHLVQNRRVPARSIVVIRNGIDLTRFTSRTAISPQPQRALVLSNYMPDALRAQILRVGGRLGIAVSEVGRRRPVWRVEDDINDADLVFALGRSALEAMACKRAVIVYDYNGGDGLVTPDRFPLLRERNFSGRTDARRYTDDELAREIGRYAPGLPEEVYRIIEREHDVRHMARQYVALYGEALAATGAVAATFLELQVRQYAALSELVRDTASLRVAEEARRRALEAIRHSRSWRAVTTYQGIKRALLGRRGRGRTQQGLPRILVVDDDTLVTQWLAYGLRTEGYQVDVAASGRAALERVEGARYDVILSDLRMPDLDGVSLYQELDRRRPDVARRVIFLTGNAAAPEYGSFLAEFEGRSISKPVELGHLSMLIQRVLGASE